MIFISYNGLFMKVVRTNLVSREIVMSPDKVTYLWTKWVLDCHCVYNPAATSFHTDKEVGSGDVAPTEVAGEFPAMTDAAVRHLLSQPQKQLIADMIGRPVPTDHSNTKDWLVSPLPVRGSDPPRYYTCDTAGTGPIPEQWDVIQNHADHTFLVHFRISTCINESTTRYFIDAEGNEFTPLLSHRWTRYVDVDEDHFAVFVTEGEAIFRVDELLERMQWPDQFRGDLFHPIPKNCQRDSVNVTALPDETGVRYRIVDSERAFNFNNNNKYATRIDVSETSLYSRGSTAVGFVNTVKDALRSGGNPFTLVGSFIRGSSIQLNRDESIQLPNFLGGKRITGGNVQDLMLGSLPRFGMSMSAQVWGNRYSIRDDLKNIAYSVIAQRLNFHLQENAPSTKALEIAVSQDVTGKWVLVQITVTWGMENLIAPFANPGTGVGEVTTWKGLMEFSFKHEETPLYLVSNETQANPAPPSGKGTRGTSLERIIAQVLTGQDQLPAKPPSNQFSTLDLDIEGQPQSPWDP